ncbi:MAG: hypothetical protein IKV25_02395 [Clostridia bacterium]|nr:hypothetical protein [Clostridia bacterium]
MEDKKSLFEKYKVVSEDEGVIEESKEPETTEIKEEPVEDLVAPSTNDTEGVFEYNFKDDEEINEIVDSVLGKEEPISMTVTPLVVNKESQEQEPVKEKKAKEKKVKEPKPPKEKKEKGELAEPVTKKDYITIALALVAVILAMSFVVVKYLPMDGSPTTDNEQTTVAEQDLANIQISREGSLRNYVQSDIANVFYKFSSDYSLQYYQYRDNQMVPVKSTGTFSASVDFGPAKLPVTIDYVKVGDEIFGVGLFRPDQHPDVNLFNVQLIMFKLTNMPKGYGTGEEALLVAKITSAADLEKEYDRWTESFKVNLTSGKCSRFLSVASREIDSTTGTYVEDFCVLTTEGYNAANGKVPFLSGRNYDMATGKDDIFIKSGTSESVVIRNVANKMLLVDGDAVVFMRYTETGFNIYRYADKKESVVFEFTGSTNRCIFADEYILDKEKGTLYNLKTGKETLLVGYKMTSPEIMKVSPDGKYLVVMGIMDNVMDYQVHVYNIETGEYAKYQEDNYSNVNNLSKNLSFIDNNTVMYMLADPNRGRECVILDVSKAFE